MGFDRKGPGILLRDILGGDDPQILAARDVIALTQPDILLLTNFDYDLGLQALGAFANALQQSGIHYPYKFAFRPNSGIATGLDLNGDGRFGTARDTQGYGDFAGQGGMAILSRYPVNTADAQDFSSLLWHNFPDAIPPENTAKIQRLSSVGHWDVPVELPDGSVLHLLAYHATTPAFDGPEDFNGRRNHDENAFWLRYLDGELSWRLPDENFIILGDANLDPADGDGRQSAISAMLSHPKIHDPQPKSQGAIEASAIQGGVNQSQTGDPALDTADWRDENGPGNLRVDYVLPSVDLTLTDAGVFWPASGEEGFDFLSRRDPKRSWHGLVWVDISR
ncbi:MAG: endonuclease/exonuclease/phosphatase family protein [Paracoccaceae bacterium]